MKRIKKFNEVEQEITFNSKSLEKDKDENPTIKTSIEDQEEIEKKFKKDLEKVQKFEAFIEINIDNVENMECETEFEDDDDSEEFDSEYEEGEGCGCCGNCSGQEDCECGCEDCKCDSDEESSELASDDLMFHIIKQIPVSESIFRPGSEKFFSMIKEARRLFDKNEIELCDIDKELYESTEIGKFAYFNGELVPLDLPMENIEEMNEAEYKGKEVKLNYPMRSSGPKKYKVYVKNPKTKKVICVNFGDVKGGLTSKVNDPEARKSFAARHQCHLKKDKTKAGYWACRLPKYKHLVNTTYSGWW